MLPSTCASLPTFGFLLDNRRRYAAISALLLLAFIPLNLGNDLGAAYFANSEGQSIANVITIGKHMAEYRDPGKWLVYHDAGALCYYSDWNTHETIGLTNRQIARRQISLKDIYADPDSQLLMRDFDLAAAGQAASEEEYSTMLSGYGFQHVEDLPILLVPGQRDFVIAVYARDPGFARTVLGNIQVSEQLQPDLSYYLYKAAKDVFGR